MLIERNFTKLIQKKVGASPVHISAAKFEVSCAYNYGRKFSEKEVELDFVETKFVGHFYKRRGGKTKNAERTHRKMFHTEIQSFVRARDRSTYHSKLFYKLQTEINDLQSLKPGRLQ